MNVISVNFVGFRHISSNITFSRNSQERLTTLTLFFESFANAN